MTVSPIASTNQLPSEKLVEYTGDLEACCALFLAKFHSLPDIVYQYKHRYFFPLTETYDGGIL